MRIHDHLKGNTPPYNHNLPETMAIPNGYFNYDLSPNLKFVYGSHNFSTNKWGFRSPEYDPIKPEGVSRIFCFGGSSTFDPYVSNEGSWASLVGSKLSEKLGRNVESINAGRYGYGTSEILGLFFHRVLRHQPDLIILYTTFNNQGRVLSPYYSVDDGPQIYGNPILSFLNKRFALFAFLNFQLRHRAPQPIKEIYGKIFPLYAFFKEPPPEHNEYIIDKVKRDSFLLESFKRDIETIVMIAKRNNVKVLISTQIIEPKRKNKMMSDMTQMLKDIAMKEEVALLDVDKFDLIDPKEEGILQTYVHLTSKGCDFLADKMVETIIKKDLLQEAINTETITNK